MDFLRKVLCPSTYVVALDEPDSIGPRVSGYLEPVEYVQNGDPNHRDWDDWPLRMTFRINSFLRDQGDVGEPDLALLGFLDN